MKNPLFTVKNAIYSMLSEEGKLSVKRSISALFAIAIVYMVWFFLNKRVPVEDQATLKYIFAGLCIMIALLTGVATVKDIISLKNGNPQKDVPAEVLPPVEDAK